MKLPFVFHTSADVDLDSGSELPTEIVRKQDTARMALVLTGDFLMGTPEQGIPQLIAAFGRTREVYACETPQRVVTLDAFYIDKYEVTNEMYQRFCKATGYCLPGHWENGEYPFGEDRHPVHGVNWHDANAYASWAGVSLPTEAQWEKAARGTDGRLFPWGNDLDYHKAYYLRFEYFQGKEGFDGSPIIDGRPTAEVGSHSQGSSPYGVMDMLGNVWEWCMDWYDCTYYAWGPSTNPTGPQTGEKRVLRGCGSVYDLHKFRCSYRYADKPDTPHTELIGFRCCYNPI